MAKKRQRSTGPIQRELHRGTMSADGIEVHVVIPVLPGKQLVVDMHDGEVRIYERSVRVLAVRKKR